MTIKGLRNEIERMCQEGKTGEVLLRIKELSSQEGDNFAEQLRQLENLWKTYQTAIYVKIYTLQQISSIMVKVVLPLFDKIVDSLVRQNKIESFLSREAGRQNAVNQIQSRKTEAKNGLKEEISALNFLFFSEPSDEAKEIKRPLFVALFDIYSIFFSFLAAIIFSNEILEADFSGKIAALILLISAGLVIRFFVHYGVWNMRQWSIPLFVSSLLCSLFISIVGDLEVFRDNVILFFAFTEAVAGMIILRHYRQRMT